MEQAMITQLEIMGSSQLTLQDDPQPQLDRVNQISQIVSQLGQGFIRQLGSSGEVVLAIRGLQAKCTELEKLAGETRKISEGFQGRISQVDNMQNEVASIRSSVNALGGIP